MQREGMISEDMRISLESILPSLAKSLYGNDWRISIRELLQNCNDANVEAQLHDPNLSDGSLQIRIVSNRLEGTLIIQDEGIGMNLDEVKENLATIGAGNKRKRLEQFSRDPSSKNYEKVREIIGQYGIGFLASFIIAREVEVITKSRRNPNEPAQRCIFSGETKWYHEEYKTKSADFGTRMTLYLNDNFKGDSDGKVDLLNPKELDDVITKYGDLIRYPINRCNSLEDEAGRRLNIMNPPWEMNLKTPEDSENFFKRRFPNSNNPLAVDLFELRKDKDKVDAKGLLYFPKLAHDDIDVKGNQLFVKRMFIRDAFDDLLPEWAKFVGVIIDCPDLTPTLDRNNVVTHDQAFANLKISLSDLIITKLTEYARERKNIFNQILQEHLRAMQFALIYDANRSPEGKEFLFRNLIDYIPFKVISQEYPSGIYTSIMEYRYKFSKQPLSSGTPSSNSGGNRDTIYYLHDPAGRKRLETLVVKKNIPVISANSEQDYLLVDAYSQKFSDKVEVIDISTVLSVFYDSEKADPAEWIRLINYYTSMSGGPQAVEVAKFEPASMPGILVVSDVNEGQAKQLEEYINVGASVLTPQLKRQMEMEMKRIKESGATFTFYINAKNSLMMSLQRNMSQDGAPEELIDDVLEEVYHNAQIYANVVSGTEEHIFSHRTKLLEQMLKDAKDLRNINPKYDKLYLENDRLRSSEKELMSENEKLHNSMSNCIDISEIPEIPETRYCAALIADLTKSTWTLASVDFKDRGDIFNRYITEIKRLVEKNKGFFDKFTGDGIIALFGLVKPDELNEDERQRICRYATTCASEIANATDIFFQMGDVASIIRKAGPHPPTSRISLTSGEIAFGRFGRSGTALGIPIVQAARMIAKKDFFKTERIISSSQFVTDLKVPITQLPDPLEKNFLIEGSFPINVYPGSI